MAENITANYPDGMTIGATTSDKIGFFGTTPAAQQSGSDQAAVGTASATSSSPRGYATTTQADGIVTLLNEIRSVLVTHGLMAGS